ncbi:MAG TPA: SAF domain-containing protein, partial [Bacillota bacterium]|nr:SAF domain-containing protein [Bacillota bacterium]
MGISFAIVFLSWFFLAGTNGNDGDEPTTVPVLVAREFLSAGTRLKGSDFEEVGLPVELLPEGVAGFDIEGKVLSYPLQKGEILFAKDLEGIQTEAKVMLTLQTDALGISQGDKIAVLVSSEEDTLTLADNLQVEEVRRNEYSD